MPVKLTNQPISPVAPAIMRKSSANQTANAMNQTHFDNDASPVVIGSGSSFRKRIRESDGASERALFGVATMVLAAVFF